MKYSSSGSACARDGFPQTRAANTDLFFLSFRFAASVHTDAAVVFVASLQKLNFVCEYNIVDGCISTAELYKVSPSGRWIATTFREEVVGSDGYVSYVEKVAFYNTETETTTIVEDYGESSGMFATDDGIAFIGMGTMAISASKVYDLNMETDLSSLEDWVSQNCGIIISGGFVKYVSPDGNLLGKTFYDGSFLDWYVIPVR